jgi:hypothetical protein
MVQEFERHQTFHFIKGGWIILKFSFRHTMVVAAVTGLLWNSSLVAVNAAEAADKRPLSEAFNTQVIVPYDYHGKAFVLGKLNSTEPDYEMVRINGRVMVPIRLMSLLASQADGYTNNWQTNWQSEKPNEVVLFNYSNAGTTKQIKFTVGSKTMLVNNKPVEMDVAPQKVNGRIVLPLRSAAEALDKKIDWLKGLILIGDEYVNLQSPQTLALIDRLKSELTNPRQRVDGEKVSYPLTKYGNTSYYYKSNSSQLFKKSEGGKESQVPLIGNPNFSNSQLLDNKLYYISTTGDQSTLYSYDVTKEQVEEVSPIGQWDPTWGWLADVRKVGNDLYVNLHFGDWTMGGETLYRVENGKLREITSTKSFNNYVTDIDSLYWTNFNPMADPSNNVYLHDYKTGKELQVGQDGYTYGITRTIDSGSISLRYNDGLYVNNGYVYVLGYKEEDPNDKSAVYKINVNDQTQTKLTPATNEFWVADNRIFYLDAQGSIVSIDLNGGHSITLANRAAFNVKLIDGSFYYTTSERAGGEAVPGILYRYTISNGVETKLSDQYVSSYYVGAAGIYYVSDGYDRGLYKVGANGNSVRLVDDYVDQVMLTESGIVYTLAYKEGIYSVQ